MTGKFIKDRKMKKELLKPCMIRLKPSLKETIEVSAEIHSDGNFNREIRELIRIGLKNRKINRHENEEKFCNCCRCIPCQCSQQDIDEHILSNC